MQEEQKKVLADVADTLLNEPTIITVDIIKPNRLQRLLMFFRLIPGKKTFEVKAACIATMVRISAILLEIDFKAFQGTENFLNTNYGLMEKHGRSMCKAIATAIHNGRNPAPEWMIDFLMNNLTAAEMRMILSVVLQKINIEDFMISIMSSTGMNLLNPKE